MVKVQKWLDKNYPKEERKETTELNIGKIGEWNLQGMAGKTFKGLLNFKGFTNLERLFLPDNKITGLNINDCPNLKCLNCDNNSLTKLDLSNNLKLEELQVEGNNFPERDLSMFSHLINLRRLKLGNNNFAGSLEPLKKLNKLNFLAIHNTNIDSGLEYLPDSVKELWCGINIKKDAKVKAIYDLFANEQGVVELQEWDKRYGWGDIKDFPQKFQVHKQRTNLNFTKEEIEQWIEAGLTIDESDFIIYLKEKGYEPDMVKENKARLWLDFYYPKGLKRTSFRKFPSFLDKTKDDKFVLTEKIIFTFPLKEIPSKHWSKVEVSNDWDQEYVEAENDESQGWPGSNKVPMMDSYGIDTSFNDGHSNGPWDRRFKNQKVLDGFKKYAEINFLEAPQHNTYIKPHGSPSIINLKVDGWVRIHEPSRLTKALRDANKLFVRNGYGKVTSQEAFEFLQSIIESQEIQAIVELEKDDEFDLKAWTAIELDLFNKRLTGELDLQNFPNLRVLNCENNESLSCSLALLPKSLETIYCTGSLAEELKNYHKQENGYNYQIWRRNYEDQKELNKPSKRGWKTNLEGIDIAPFIPTKEAINLQESHQVKEPITYSKIEKSEGKVNQWKAPPQESLPIKLYNIEKDQIEEINSNSDIQNYAVISYVWGQLGTVDNLIWNTQYQDKLNPAGYKSLYKAVQTCKHLSINYLWMDQLCINQNSTEEKNQEVPKMRQYYNNAAVTLIPVQTKLENNDAIDTIASSEWFKRSWTFQEGWLSKHTIFMFDDKLIDGRNLATDWVFNQPGYSEYAQINVGERDNVKVATPIGWVYFKDGYSDEDKISLTLSQVLRGTKPRQRTLSIDGIYSVLGLLPYGNKVIPKYKEWGQEYTQQDLLEALFDIMKTSWENGYGEALAWHGEGHDLIPSISSLSKGSTSVVGGIVVKHKNPSLNFKPEGVELSGYEYVIDEINGELEEIESSHRGFLIDSGLCAKNVKAGDEEIKLWGPKETLEKVKVGNVLIIPSPSEWESNIPFAILAKKNGETYQRIGLVELRDEDKAKKLQKDKVKDLIISMSKYSREKIIKRQTTILVEPKFEQKEQGVEELISQNKKLLKEIQELQRKLSTEQAKKEHWKNKYLTYKQMIENCSQEEEKAIERMREILNEVQQTNIHRWKNINQSFTPELVQEWIQRGFNYKQVQDWINVGLSIQDYALVAWLRNVKKMNAEEVLNDNTIDINALKQEFREYQQSQLNAQIIHNPPK